MLKLENVSKFYYNKGIIASGFTKVNLELKLDMTPFIRDTLLNFYYMNQSHYNPNITNIKNIWTNVTMNCKIVHDFSDNYGKEAENKENLIFMELEHFYKHLANSLDPEFDKSFPGYRKLIYNTNPTDYGTLFIVNFPPNRVNAYIESDFDVLLEKGTRYANTLITQMSGLEHIQVAMPLIQKMEKYNYGSVLLNLSEMASKDELYKVDNTNEGLEKLCK